MVGEGVEAEVKPVGLSVSEQVHSVTPSVVAACCAEDVSAPDDAVLSQTDDNDVDRPVSFFSKKFNKHQLNYSTIEKEALALIWGLQFSCVCGRGVPPIVVYSDHNPLLFSTPYRVLASV